MSSGYPIVLDLAGKPIVIIGGGGVAARKAQGLIQAGAKAGNVLAVAPNFGSEFPADVRRQTAVYSPACLDGAALVFAATDSPEVNAAVVRDARQRGIWVNRADLNDEDAGDFSVAAVFHEGPAIVAVSTQSPALSAMIRSNLHMAWDSRWTAMAEAMRTLRPVIRNGSIPPERRREMFIDLTTEAALDTLANGGDKALMDWISSRYPELANR